MTPRLAKLVLILLLIIFLGFDLTYILKLVPVWPDETMLADIANNVMREHRFGSDLLKGLVGNIENYGSAGYPPLYFAILAGWFKIFGLSIFHQRLLSIIFSLFFLIIYFLFSKTFFIKQKSLFPVLAVGFLIFDYTFLRSTVIGRFEILILLLGITSLHLLQAKKPMLSLCGLLLGITVLIHYTSLIFIFVTLIYLFLLYKSKTIKIRELNFFLIPFFIVSLGWIIYLYLNKEFFLELIILALQIKETHIRWLWSVFAYHPLPLKLIFLGYIVVTWEYAIFAFQQRNLKYYLILLCLVFAWLFSYFYNLEFSYSTIAPFVYLSLCILISYYFSKMGTCKNSVKFFLISMLAILIFTLNLHIYLKNISDLSSNNFSYDLFSKRILSIIPDNKTVFLSAIPDPYFAFKESRSNKMYQFYPLVAAKENILNILDDSDYIIFNSPLGPNSNIVMEYIKRNTADTYPVGDNNQYQAYVIKLTPKEKRVTDF